MAKDDYHVIVYKILAYLYVQLKAGKAVDPEMLEAHGKLYDINEYYWNYIFNCLFSEGYVMSTTAKAWGKELIPLSDIMITPKGIEYLTDNSFMNKVRKFVKETSDVITPFIK